MHKLDLLKGVKSYRTLVEQTLSREALVKGKAQYYSPPCTDSFGSAHFCIESIINLLTRQTTLIRRHDTQHNDIQHKDTQHKGLICTQHK